MSWLSEFAKGVWRENPVFVLLLGLCPTLAVTTGIGDAFGMGVAVTFVLVCSNLIISLGRNYIPPGVRISCYIVIITTFVTVVRLAMAAYTPALKESLGIFLPLIAVNCIIFARAEAFASRSGPWVSVADGLGMGVGATLALCVMAAIREILGTGSFAGIPLAEGLEPYTQKIFIIAPGGFLTIALLLAFLAWVGRVRKAANRRCAGPK